MPCQSDGAPARSRTRAARRFRASCRRASLAVHEACQRALHHRGRWPRAPDLDAASAAIMAPSSSCARRLRRHEQLPLEDAEALYAELLVRPAARTRRRGGARSASGPAALARRAAAARPGAGRRTRRHLERAASRPVRVARLAGRADQTRLPSRSRTTMVRTTYCTPATPSAPCRRAVQRDFRPSSKREALAVLVDRGGRELPMCRRVGRARHAAARAAAVARARSRGRFSFEIEPGERGSDAPLNQPAAQSPTGAHPSASIEGLPRRGVTQACADTARQLSIVNEREGQEGAAAAPARAVQPVLRELDAHPHQRSRSRRRSGCRPT